VRADVALECGWGRLVFGQTFADVETILDVLESEAPNRRDICIYARYPQVLVGLAPHELFIDPSVTFRLDLTQEPVETAAAACGVRELEGTADAIEVNRIYSQTGMVTADVETLVANGRGGSFVYLLAEDEAGGVIGTVTGVDHRAAFDDDEAGTSLWCLAVDPQTGLPGVGRTLVVALAGALRERGRAWMDLSVLHDNHAAIALYEQLGFARQPLLVVKRKNPINEPLFTTPIPTDGLNPYAKIIASEARRRGISVRVLDPGWGEMELAYAGRRVVTREALSERTSAVAMSRCDDKRISRRIFAEAGLRVPAAAQAAGDEADRRFLAEHGEVVVKPARGEQGAGITVGVTDPGHLREAVEVARVHCPDVLIEELCEGHDLRIVVIDHEVVAAAVRRPASVIGTGRHTVAELVEKQSRRRAAATGGESRIPIDDHTRDTIAKAGHAMDSVLDEGESLLVRRTANLHTGGTIHDVTPRLHQRLAEIAVAASHALAIPVVGLDMLVPDVEGAEYVIIEANERPGLANHEPQPTAERFVDLLFPQTRRTWKEARP
jgi:GNAT-family acetyltransferase (TIGR03103 family)